MDEPEEIRLTVPGKPVPKGRARSRIVTLGDGRQFVNHYTPKETENEEATIRYCAGQVMGGRALMTGPLEILICAYRPIPSSWSNTKIAKAVAGEIFPIVKPDWDNYAKVQDALNKVVWGDDAQIVDAHVYKRYSSRPRLTIIVKKKTLSGVFDV